MLLQNRQILYFLLLFMLMACQEVYEPEGLSSDEKILVVDGLFIDTDSYITVSVSYAEVFGVDSYDQVTDALVWLMDDNANSYPFEGSDRFGTYLLSTNDLAISDSTQFFIHVETSDGFIYESMPQFFPDNITVKEINASIGEKEFTSKNDAGEVISSIFTGLHLDISLNSEDSYPKYVRFADTAVYQSMYSQFSPHITSKCVSYHALSTIPITESTININDSEEINNRNIGFLRYILDNDYQNQNSSSRITDSWVLMSNVFSVTKECFNYYNKIITQVSAQNKIFDPAPTQVLGNMKCISDSTKTVLGFFEMSRRTTTYVAFYWVEGEEEYSRIDLDSYDAPNGSFCTEHEPQFDWISFE